MKHEKIIIIEKEATKYIKNLLTVGDELFGEDNTICYTAKFDDGIEMDIKCCGVQYEEGSNNTCWTEAVLFKDNRQISVSEPDTEFFGEWELEYEDNTYIAIVKENTIEINCNKSFLGKDIKEYALNSEEFHAQLLKNKYYTKYCKYPPKDDVYYEVEYMSVSDCAKQYCNPSKEGIYLIRDTVKSPKRVREEKMSKKIQYWQLFNDGWFEYWLCPCCGHKQQLKIDKKPLPLNCPKCKKTLSFKFKVRNY